MVHWAFVGEMTWKMLLAVVLGGLVGYERETHGRPAGLRTHMLVCVGAALFTIASISIADLRFSAGQMGSIRFDPGRIAAQIVSGIGFLGAGTIIRQGSVIRGLTTAASLWAVAAVGIAVGIGGDMLLIAVVGSLIVFGTLSIINRMEHGLIAHRRYRDLIVTLEGGREVLGQLLATLTELGIDVHGLEQESAEGTVSVFRLHLRLPASLNYGVVTDRLTQAHLVRGFQWD